MPTTIPHTKLRGGKLYLNLPIPTDLRSHFPTSKGKLRTHIVEALGTGDPTEGRRAAGLRRAHWVMEFERLRKGHRGELPSDIRKAYEFRDALVEAQQQGPDTVEAIEFMVSDYAEKVGTEGGAVAAKQFYDLASQPDRLTLLKAMERMNDSPDIRESTKRKREQALRELLEFLKVPDCLPDYLTDARAVAYVDWLNSGELGYSTKQDRLSNLQALWNFLARKRQVERGASPWTHHELTGRKRPTAAGEGEKRGWRDAEVLKLFQAPDKKGAKHYRRPLFRELYALGFLTGMRLEEIVALTPRALEEIEGGYWVTVEAAKTDAGVRGIPVVHPAAMAILQRRVGAQENRSASIFPECRPGGPDNRLSWQVQKALGRDRDALGFGPEVDFHSTRRSFMTLMENAEVDVVHVQRYVGHRVPTLMHSVYSDGASRDSLRKVAVAVRYPKEIEEEFAKTAGI